MSIAYLSKNHQNIFRAEILSMEFKKYFKPFSKKPPSEKSGHPHKTKSGAFWGKLIRILTIKLVVFLAFILFLTFFGVSFAQAPLQALVAQLTKPNPIVQSKTVLPASVQSSIEDIAKQQIQKQEANATLPSSSIEANVIPANASIVEEAVKNIQIALTSNPTSKAKLRLEKIDRLITQLQNILASDRSADAINRAVGLVQTIGIETGKVAGDPKVQSDRVILTLLIQQYNRVQIALQTVEDTLPMDGYLKVEAARVKYVLKPAQDSINNAPNLEVVNSIGTAQAAKIVGQDFAELKSIEILTDLSSGLSPQTQTKFVPIQKELVAGFEKRMLKLPADVRQRKLDDYMNF